MIFYLSKNPFFEVNNNTSISAKNEINKCSLHNEVINKVNETKEKTSLDEFEMLSLENGKYSSFIIEDENGVREIKKWGETYFSCNKNTDEYEDNDSLDKTTPFFKENVNHYYHSYSCMIIKT